MKNPFGLIKVQSEGAKRLAWFCSTVASVAVMVFLVCIANKDKEYLGKVIVLTAVFGVVVFFLVGYLVTGIAWVVEGFRKNKPRS